MGSRRKKEKIRKRNEDKSTFITFIVKSMNRIIHKKTCRTENEKDVNEALKILEVKGFINLKDIKKDKKEDWF